MPNLTLESLAARVATLEEKIAALRSVVAPTRDWQSVVGISEETEFSRSMLAEMEVNREADRKAALAGTAP
jgi:hypothetical protein